MFLRIRRSTTLLIVMMLLWRTKANIMAKLDCSNSDQLCPGTDSITMKCTIYNSYLILVWEMFDDLIDFTTTTLEKLEKSQSHVLGGVTFNGELVNDSIAQYESTLTFNPSLATEEFSITCLSGNSNAYAQCQISFRDPPPTPTNLTSRYLHDSSEVLLSWTPPPLSTSIDLAYSITVTPPTSTDDTLLFITTNNSLTLDVSSFQRNVSYSVSINTITCNNSLPGESSTNSSFIIPILESPPSSITPSTDMIITNTHFTSLHITPTTYRPSSSAPPPSSSLSSAAAVAALSSSSTAPTQSLYSISTTPPSTPTIETSINLTPAELIGYIGVPTSLVVSLLLPLCAVSLFIWCRWKRKSSAANEMKKIEPPPDNNENAYTVTIPVHSQYNSEQLESTSSIQKYQLNPINCELQMYASASLPTSCLIEPSNLKLLEKVGQGEFGIVYRGILTKHEHNEQTIIPVAIKTVKRMYSQSVLANHLIDEAEKMVRFNHYNVLSLTGVCFGLLESPCIVMPFMSNGSLLSYLRKESANLTVFESAADENLILSTTKQLLSMCLQVAKGMVYLADKKFIHRDLAARNCMISSDGVIKVSDFGLAEDVYTSGYFKLSSDLNNESVNLPIKWMALESIHLETFNEKTDVWSYGVLCWEVFTIGRMPYAGISPKELIQLLDSGERLIKPSTPTCTDEIYSLIESCWHESPEKRPHFTDIVDSVEQLIVPLAEYIDLNLNHSQDLIQQSTIS